ncbi:hypothetical protein [Polymorphospora rubra]|uniref:DUF4175 domain-containing protein n=1 Tax=Polymorphospora rubra TaxID=338584 RepID=A0A810MST2_9ACTN|nr:hypothetical protein [Polymorphospora rubra]BCJ64012.1 hypothetical protein Prubr_10330 [Polymorphospora rubra]
MQNAHPLPARIAGWTGLVAHLATLVWYAASGLLAPGWAVLLLLLVWAGLLAVAIVLLRRRPAYVLLVPVVSALFWFGAISAGEAWLGWTG